MEVNWRVRTLVLEVFLYEDPGGLHITNCASGSLRCSPERRNVDSEDIASGPRHYYAKTMKPPVLGVSMVGYRCCCLDDDLDDLGRVL
jgi:hypothetical protein